MGNVAVGILDDEDAETLATALPPLRGLLFGAPNVREIARRPFFAAVLAEQPDVLARDSGRTPQTESELIHARWRAGGYDVQPEAADMRQRAILDLAERGAPSLGKTIRGRSLRSETIGQLEGLRRDRIIDVVETGTSYRFAHDIYFEWAFLRLLVDQGAAWPDALIVAGEPPLLARIVSLLSQSAFERADDWSETFDALGARPLRPQWRRAWLLGPSGSGRFLEHLERIEPLLARDDFALFEKFLVWFQAERTVPSPLVLRNPLASADGAMRVRAADMLGWPADIAEWRRVLAWLFDRADQLPATPLVHVVEVFRVWQNMLPDIANPFSARLLAILDQWLAELDGTPAECWNTLPSDTRKSLFGATLMIVLRAAPAHPDLAGRALDRIWRGSDVRRM